jgi:hypothetical protein
MDHLPFWYINVSVVWILAYCCLNKLSLLLPGGEKPELECYTTQELYFEVCSLYKKNIFPYSLFKIKFEKIRILSHL